MQASTQWRQIRYWIYSTSARQPKRKSLSRQTEVTSTTWLTKRETSRSRARRAGYMTLRRLLVIVSRRRRVAIWHLKWVFNEVPCSSSLVGGNQAYDHWYPRALLSIW